MATIKRLFASESTVMNAEELHATNESLSTAINFETNGYQGSHVAVSVAFHASAAQNVDLFLYGSLDGTVFDTNSFFSQRIAVSAGNTRQISFIIQDFARFRIGAKHSASESNAATVTIKEKSWRWETV